MKSLTWIVPVDKMGARVKVQIWNARAEDDRYHTTIYDAVETGITTSGQPLEPVDNDPPIAEAGEDMSIIQHETVFFDGWASEDDVEVIDWSWIFNYNGSKVILTGPEPTFRFDLAGTYTVTLIASDDTGKYGEDIIVIRVRDIERPVVDAGPDAEIEQNIYFQFDGSNSTDNVGITQWGWTIHYHGRGVQLEGVDPFHLFDKAGRWRVTLTCRDAAGYADSDELYITVLDTEKPVAYAGTDNFVDQGTTVTFYGFGCTDNVEVVSWVWTFEYWGRTAELNGQDPSFKFVPVGEFIVTLTVADARGNEDTDEVRVFVRDTTPPIAEAGPDRTVEEVWTITIDGTESYDNVGVVNWTWVVELPPNRMIHYGPKPEVSFDAPGVFIVNLTVRDAEGNTGSTSFEVRVVDITPPDVDAGKDVETSIGGRATLDGRRSWDNVGIKTYTWRYQYDGSLIQLDGSYHVVTFDIPGQYTIKLLVEDDAGNVGEDTMLVEVLDTPGSSPTNGGAPPFEDEGWPMTLWIMISVAAVLITVLVALVLLIRRSSPRYPR
jgi:PKD repeat protein